MGDANVTVNSFLTRKVTVGIEVALSSVLGWLVANPTESNVRAKVGVGLCKPVEAVVPAC
jgi:hypothetical protein